MYRKCDYATYASVSSLAEVSLPKQLHRHARASFSFLFTRYVADSLIPFQQRGSVTG